LSTSPSNSSNSSITNCTVSNCSTGQFGGGICSFNNGSKSSNINNCNVSNCSARYFGGGIYSNADAINSTTNFYITNCVVSNCSTGQLGGGIYSESSHINNKSFTDCYSYVTNCTVSNCSAGFGGGGIYSYPDDTFSDLSYTSVTNCLVSNCSAASEGGGIYTKNAYNCVSSNNNTAGLIGNGLTGNQSGCFSPDFKTVYIQPTSFIGIAKTDAQKLELANANWHLKGSSPCINAGTSPKGSTVLPEKDIDNNPRVLYGTIDIGAYEFVMPFLSMPTSEKFDVVTVWDNSSLFYNSAQIIGSQNIKWTLADQKATFRWQTNLTSAYSSPIFTYQIDATKSSKVFLRYDMYFQAYAGTISPTGTEKLYVEYSTDLITWKTIASYSNSTLTHLNS